MKPVKLKDLSKALQEAVKDGLGEKYVMIPDDDEWNGTHSLWEGRVGMVDDDLWSYYHDADTYDDCEPSDFVILQ